MVLAAVGVILLFVAVGIIVAIPAGNIDASATRLFVDNWPLYVVAVACLIGGVVLVGRKLP